MSQIRLEYAGPRGKSRFAKQLGLSPSTYDYYEASRVPPVDVLIRISEVAGVDLGWLLTGRKSADGLDVNNPIVQRAARLLREQPSSARPLAAFLEILEGIKAFPPKENSVDDVGQGNLAAENVAFGAVGKVASAGGGRRGWIPILGRSAAGISHFWADDEQVADIVTLGDLIEKHVGEVRDEKIAAVSRASSGDVQQGVQIITLDRPDVPGGAVEFIASEAICRKYPDAFALRIDGDSMSPEIFHGDIVVLSPSVRAVVGEPAVIQLAGAIGVTCKIYHPADDGLHMVAANADYKPTIVPMASVNWALKVLAKIR
ncbi:MAG TPA: S24 family peptidase [Phycisphaerae bacterium]|nr:S24 family peptidase [Phycisphaerae bacterium]